MYFTYILKSIKNIKYYTGHTNNLGERLVEHNAGKSKYSKRYAPWKVVYREIFETEDEAVRREKYFKSSAGRKWLKKHINK